MSSRFIKVFNSLPPEAQQTLVEKHLAGLLDVVPKEKSKKIVTAATQLQRKHKEVPKLDLRVKRRQIADLIVDLGRDAKTSLIKERSNRDELLSEIFHGLVGWLNVIWTVVYEHNVQFAAAHSCLIFVADALIQLSETSTLGGCKCSVMNLPVDFKLKDKKGKILKRFSILGPQNVDRILLWIWRDLFVSLFATGSERDKARVPEFLEEIQESLGASALEKLLHGGEPIDEDDWEGEDDFWFDEGDSEEEDSEYGDEDSEYDSDESELCNFHASYWTEPINRARIPLRECVEKRLLAVFKETPSLGFYNSLSSISQNVLKTESQLLKILQEIAGDTPENLVAALDIYISNNDYGKIASLLDKYMYLLRPRDAMALQCAVAVLADSPFRSRSLTILEKELDDSLHAIRAMIRTCFVLIEDESSKKELLEILKLKAGSQRKTRVEQWAERVCSSSGNPMGPMAFAAMMMGFPMLPGVEEGDDSDLINYFDMDPDDPDFDNVREQYRPNGRVRFDGWVHLGQGLPGGPAVLAKTYFKAVEMMPYVRGQDIVNEITNKLRERPNKGHVVDALSNLSSFVKLQRKKLNLAHVEKKPKGAAATTSQAKSSNAKPNNNNANGNASGSKGTQPKSTRTTTVLSANEPAPLPPPPPSSTRAPLPSVPGGLEDVD